jgi:hypothetical protein
MQLLLPQPPAARRGGRAAGRRAGQATHRPGRRGPPPGPGGGGAGCGTTAREAALVRFNPQANVPYGGRLRRQTKPFIQLSSTGHRGRPRPSSPAAAPPGSRRRQDREAGARRPPAAERAPPPAGGGGVTTERSRGRSARLDAVSRGAHRDHQRRLRQSSSPPRPFLPCRGAAEKRPGGRARRRTARRRLAPTVTAGRMRRRAPRGTRS